MAGELVVEDWQFELRGVLFGPNTSIKIRRGSPTGLGQPAVKPHDMPLHHGKGSIGGREDPASRVLTWACYVRAATPASAMVTALSLLEAFATSSVDLDLYGQMPGIGRFRVAGRPRGCDMDLSLLSIGQVDLFPIFHALDPTIHEVP